MLMHAYLIVTRRSIIRIAHRPPSLDVGEYAISLTLDIHPNFFHHPYPRLEMAVNPEEFGNEIQVNRVSIEANPNGQ